MFSPLMAHTWAAATLVGLVAGWVGFYTVMRGSAFAAHALPNGAFAGAAGASLLGANTVLGLGVFSVGGAVVIAALGRRIRHDVATALVIVTMLATGALFVSLKTVYAEQVYQLLFGQIFGVSSGQLDASLAIAAACAISLLLLHRPLLLSSAMPEVGAARGLSPSMVEAVFLIVIAMVTTMAVPVVGALLVFSLLISPAAAARQLTSRPVAALLLGIAFALLEVWVAIAVNYRTELPVGFLVGTGGAVIYAAASIIAWVRLTRPRRPALPSRS
jgi:zinc/manganese transport system permease protein